MPEIRYEAALDVAGRILAMAGIPATPELLSRATYAVLDTLYAVESRPCPRCRRPMCPADDAGRD